MPGKHGPNRLANYIKVHESWMGDLIREGFVIEDECDFTFLPSAILLAGTIVCLDGITLDVDKEIEVLRGRGMTADVRTRLFRYHAWVRGVHNILRYESVHEHRRYPHKHVYNTFGDGLEIEVVDLMNEDEVPTLGEVLRELQGWHEQHAARLKELP